jgi:hypothetical protein
MREIAAPSGDVAAPDQPTSASSAGLSLTEAAANSGAAREQVSARTQAAPAKTWKELARNGHQREAFEMLGVDGLRRKERTTGYHEEVRQNGTWNEAVTDASGARIQGTVIGQRQLWQLSSTTADAIALVIDSARSVPAIAEFGAY